MLDASPYLILSAVLFAIGALGVLVRRNVFVLLMSIEMMLNAGNLALITFSRFVNSVDGQVMAVMVIAVAATEVAVGLGILILIHRQRAKTDIDEINLLNG
jgi:NADH-quinone oxidoreductase subunit K